MRLRDYFHGKIVSNTIIKIYSSIFILFLVIISISYFTGIPIEIFTRDPAVIATSETIIPFIDDYHNPFLGIISQIGILFWCISASLCLFCSVIIVQKKSSWYNYAYFLRFFGLITLILLLDDLFLLHESIFPQILKTPEELIYFCYVVTVIIGLIKYKKIILQTNWIVFLLSLIFFSFSMIIDKINFFTYSVGLTILLEDGFKLLGIVSWLCYFGFFCLETMKKLILAQKNNHL